MKVFLLYAKENWITDEFAKEWIENNEKIYTNNIEEADIIWILSDYIAYKLDFKYIQKKIITTIHHIVPCKMDNKMKKHFEYLNEITDLFHSACDITTNEMKKYFTKPITTLPFWHNENVWKYENKKDELRKKYGFKKEFLIGSFQRDTEGNSISNRTYMPKLEKGPDIFVQCVLLLKNKYPNIKVVLTGYCRQYIIRKLNEKNIDYVFFEMIGFTKLNEIFNCLDLYIVSSRVEGGPRAINECSLTKTPLLSTNVGIASLICHKDSIFDLNDVKTILNSKTNVEHSFKMSQLYTIKNYMKTFTQNLIKNENIFYFKTT